MRALVDSDIAIVGLGVQTAFGGLQETAQAIAEGQCALTFVPPDGYAARVATPTLTVELPRELEPQVKFLSGSGVMAAAATHAAWTDANADHVSDLTRGLYLAQMDSDDWNCRDFRNAVHTATTPEGALEQADLNRASVRQVKPFFLLDSLKNNAFSFLATWLGLRGANTSAAGTTSLGTTLLTMAMQSLQNGRNGRALYAGAARVSAGTALHELALNERRTPATDTAPAPLTTQAAGLIPGDAAATLTLAVRSEAPADAITILGIAATTCLSDGAQAREEALTDAARIALAQAHIDLASLDAIVAPGVGTAAEVHALQTLTQDASTVPVACFAGWMGHAGLASDAVDLALTAHALRRGVLPAASLPAGATPSIASLSTQPTPLPPGATILVLSSGTFGHAGAVVLHRPAASEDLA